LKRQLKVLEIVKREAVGTSDAYFEVSVGFVLWVFLK
jgi:hypothetical protein